MTTKQAVNSGCVECGGVVLGLDHCDVCRARMHAECGRYRVVGARFLCYVCDQMDDDEGEPAFTEEEVSGP